MGAAADLSSSGTNFGTRIADCWIVTVISIPARTSVSPELTAVGAFADSGAPFEVDRKDRGEASNAHAIDLAYDLADDRREIGSREAQVAAARTADEEFVGADLVADGPA